MTARRGRPAPPQELRDDRRPQRPRELLHEVGGPARREPVEQLSDRTDLQPERRHAPLLSFCPPSATTTTVATTTILSASSTTTTVFTTTTTTAPPLPCPGLSGLVRVQCQLAAAQGRPLCGNEVVPPSVDHALRAKLNAANAALGSATTATGRKGKKLRKRGIEMTSQVGPLQGAILGLLGLLLAFSFAAAGARFLERLDSSSARI